MSEEERWKKFIEDVEGKLGKEFCEELEEIRRRTKDVVEDVRRKRMWRERMLRKDTTRQLKLCEPLDKGERK